MEIKKNGRNTREQEAWKKKIFLEAKGGRKESIKIRD